MKNKIKKIDIAVSLVIVIFISLNLVLFPKKTTDLILFIRNKSINNLSPFYLILSFSIVVYSIYICFSKYGNIKLGDGEPEHSLLTWLTMIFCTGMGSNLLYWSGIEWMYYYNSPPLNAVSKSKEAIQLAVTYGGFHWSITGWAIYGIGAITLGLRYYNLKKYGLCLAASCDGIYEGFTKNKIILRIVELIFLFGAIGGYTTMIAFVIPMYGNNLALLFGVKNGFGLQVELILMMSIIFTISSCSELKNGIKKLSKINVLMAIILIMVIILSGPTMFIIKSIINSLGFMGQNFIKMSLWTDFIGESKFPENWTSFYWAWWIGLSPSMWIFISKISKGRKIREILLGTIASGSIGCWLYFGGISNYGIYQQLNRKIDLVKILEKLGPEEALSQLVLSFNFGKVIMLFWTITGIIFLITTMDSGAYTLAVSTTLKLKESDQPSKKLRFFWSVLLMLLPIGLIYTKAPMEALQAFTVLTAIPIGFLMIFVVLSGYKYLKKENEKLT